MNRVKKEEKANPDLFKGLEVNCVDNDHSFEDYTPRPNPKEPLKHKHLPDLPKRKDS